jgi:polysaccharide export outer membrane protein
MKIRFLFAVIISLLVYASVFAQTLPFTAPPSPQNIPTPKGYMLGPGDEITGKVLGEKDFDFAVVVNDDGQIELPFADKAVNAKCRTEKEIRTDISGLLGKYLKEPQINLQITKKSRPPAIIYGEVNIPTQVPLYRKSTLMEFISIAGGVKEEAGGTVQVFRTTPPMCTDPNDDLNWKPASSDPTDVPSRIYSLASLRQGKEDSNPTIIPGDVIYVHRAVPIFVVGEVMAPQGIYLKEDGMSLTEAIAKIGGPRDDAKLKEIKIFRLKPNSDPSSIKDREQIVANYELIKSGKDKDVMLKPNDIIEVGKLKDSTAMQIFKFAIGAAKAMVTASSNSVGYHVLY